MMMSGVYLKDLGADNILIGMTGALQLPWTLKFAWAPLIDFYGKKKNWITNAQIILAILLGVLAATTYTQDPIRVGIAAMAFIALASATHDAAIDGYYLEALTKPQQALFVGVRNTAFRLSMIFGSGGMVCVAGMLASSMGKTNAWFTSFAIMAVVMLLLFLLHKFYLPDSSKMGDSAGAQHQQTVSADEYFMAIWSYFQQPGSFAIVLYILLFRLGDAMVMKMITPFLQDPRSAHGMGLTVAQIGTVFGTVGVCFLLLGGLLGGFLVSKQGLKRWFWPATLLMNSTILLYFMLAFFHPSSIVWIYIVNSLEQFGYGFGMASYTVFLLSTVKQEYKAAHYAVASALMAVGLMGPNMASGYLQQSLGYANFFLMSFFLTIPGMISIFFLPLWKKEDPEPAT